MPLHLSIHSLPTYSILDLLIGSCLMEKWRSLFRPLDLNQQGES